MNKKHLKIVEYLLTNMDSSLYEQVNQTLPDILIQVFRSYATGSYMTKDNLNSLAVKIMNTFNVRMNSSRDSVIQCIMEMSGQGFMALAMDLIDLVAKQDDFDVEQIVIYKRHIGSVELRPVEMAMQMKKYDFVTKLIMAGAKCRGIQFATLKLTLSAVRLLKLLYHVGIYVDIAKGDLIYSWARRQPLKSLPELAAMAVRRNYSRNELKKNLANIVLPDAINRYLNLKHLSLD